jgi:deoxyribose-phosphate aldolase
MTRHREHPSSSGSNIGKDARYPERSEGPVKPWEDDMACFVHNSSLVSMIAPLIDLTLLDINASANDIQALAIKAQAYDVAAVCIFPDQLDFIPSEIELKRATVVNFPGGDEPLSQVLSQIENIIATQKVDEIDYVFPYQAYLSGHKAEAIEHSHEVIQRCKQHHLIVKVILETGAIPSTEMIYEMSSNIIKSGSDFIKTSTGKIPQGATLPAAFAMLKAILDSQSHCGLKVSGGVKTIEQALSYMKLAEETLNRPVDKTWFRIGASSLLEKLPLTKD